MFSDSYGRFKKGFVVFINKNCYLNLNQPNYLIVMKIALVALISFLSLSQFLQAQSIPAAPVTVSEVVVKDLRKPMELVGTVEPVKRSLVSAIVSEIVVEYPYLEGDYVKAGRIISRQNTQKMRILLDEAIKAKNEASVELKYAQDRVVRAKKLHEKGIASESQITDVFSGRDVLVARQELLQSRINRLKYDISKAAVKAPFNGYITKEYSQVGEWLDSGDSVVELINIDDVHVVVELPEKYVSSVGVGDGVEATLYSLPGRKFTGEIISVVPQADPKSRTFPVKIRVKNDDHIVKSSMSAKVLFYLGETRKAKMVPKDAIVSSGNGKVIFVVRENLAQPVNVIIGLSYEGLVEVQGELTSGERVIVRGNERLRPMQPVQVTSVIGNEIS